MQIKVNGLTHIFDLKGITEFTALKKISASFTQGEFVTIIGETGSGKTTLIEHLNVLLRPTIGEININDEFLIKPGRRKLKGINSIRKRVGVVFQFAEYQLFEDVIEKDIIFGPVNMGMSRKIAREAAKKYIKLVGMDESYLQRSPFALSGGQKRRIALAGILAMEPDFLILDEPTAGLDPEGEIQMYKIFQKLNQEGKTIIIVTHNLDHVLQYSQRTILLSKGEIMMDGLSLPMMYNKDIMHKYDLEIPKLVDLVWALEKCGKKIGQIRTVKKLARKI